MTVAITPLNMDSRDVRTNLTSPNTMPSEKPRIGDIKGATNMAPITTAGLFNNNPKVAMIEDNTIRIK